MTSDSAETFALQVLAHIAADDIMLQGLLDRTGADADDFRTSAANPEFLGAVLDFLLENEEILVSICEIMNISKEMPMKARHALPGASAEW
jgi:hypothetical protein